MTESPPRAVTVEEGGSNGDIRGEDSDGVEPVEMLVTLAENGEIDPWGIDVVTVTDKYLTALEDGALQATGRALFYSTVLLRMKSDAMLREDEDGNEEDDDALQPPLEGREISTSTDGDPFDELDSEIDRRLDRKRARGMPGTLDELIRELREAERDQWWKGSREYDTSASDDYNHGTQEMQYRGSDDLRMEHEPTAGDVTGTAHSENIDDIIDSVHDAVRSHFNAGRSEVLYTEISDVAGSDVQTYLGLLFLSHRGRVRLQQDELFGDLWVQEPGMERGSGESSGD